MRWSEWLLLSFLAIDFVVNIVAIRKYQWVQGIIAYHNKHYHHISDDETCHIDSLQRPYRNLT